jgi:hypothetical protein
METEEIKKEWQEIQRSYLNESEKEQLIQLCTRGAEAEFRTNNKRINGKPSTKEWY